MDLGLYVQIYQSISQRPGNPLVRYSIEVEYNVLHNEPYLLAESDIS